MRAVAHLEASWRQAGATFITDALDGLDRHADLDQAHDSAEASRQIAPAVAERLALRSLSSP